MLNVDPWCLSSRDDDSSIIEIIESASADVDDFSSQSSPAGGSALAGGLQLLALLLSLDNSANDGSVKQRKLGIVVEQVIIRCITYDVFLIYNTCFGLDLWADLDSGSVDQKPGSLRAY